MSFAEYIAAGWRLCAIDPGGKAPKYEEWNARGLGQVIIPPGFGAGLMHAESGTCAIDIDNLPVAESWLSARGLVLGDLLTARTAVRISSRRSSRAKLLYSLLTPLQSIKTAPFRALSAKSGKEETYTALDFRCATKAGLSMQDVLPPTIHPDTGKPYAWEYGDPLFGTWRNLPPLPPELRAIWESLLTPQSADNGPAAPLGAGFDEIRTILAGEDPNAAYNEWLEVGMALHHETQGSRDGLLLWNEWSMQATGPDKYKGIGDLEPHWRSFNSNAPGAVTLGTLRARQVARAEDFALVPVSTNEPAGPEGRRKFQRRTFETFISGKPPEWIIEGVLPAATIGAIYGAPGSGKSFLATDMGMHIAEGRAWRGHSTKRMRVVYLIAEGVSGGRQRLRTARDELGFDVSGFEIIEDTPNLLDKKDPPELARELRAPDEDGTLPQIGLVIVDTLAQTIPGGDENAGKDMSVVLEHCKLIHLATGAMVLLIAHAGKDATRGIRGWSGILGALDSEMEVTELNDGLRCAKVTKLKDGEEGAAFGFRLRSVGASCVVEHTDEQPRTKAVKYREGSPESLIRQIYPTMAPMGVGVGVAVDDMVAAAVDQMPHVTGTPDRRTECVTKALLKMCTDTGSGLRIHNNSVFPRETAGADFALRPVEGQPGIDAEPPPVQNHSDLLGV